MSKETRKKAIEFIDEVYEKKDRTIKLQWTPSSYKIFNELVKEEYERLKRKWRP